MQPKIKNIVISGTNFWNPGDDFVRDGVIRILKELFSDHILNFHFYNFNQDFFPQSKFTGISNMVAKGDLEQYRDFVDAVVIAGLSAGTEIKDLYSWIIANNLQDRVYLIGAGYENNYVEKYIYEEPEATVFKSARIITGRTKKTPDFIPSLKLPYYHINCPAILSVPCVKNVEKNHSIKKIGFSIQLPHGVGIPNQCCSEQMYKLAVNSLIALSSDYQVEVIAHHKSEYFHFLNLLKDKNIPVYFSSFYQDFFTIYPQYDVIITTRLHSSLFGNGFGIPGIIINDTDRHTHCLDGFPHSTWVTSFDRLLEEFERLRTSNLADIAANAESFKKSLLSQYIKVLKGAFNKDHEKLEEPAHSNLKEYLRMALADSENKCRVLNIFKKLTPDKYLHKNISNFSSAIATRDEWFDSVTFLNWYAHTFKPQSYIEVGVRRGRSMAQVVMESPPTICFGFDMWIPDYAGEPNEGPTFVVGELANLGAKTLPTLIKGNSQVTLPNFLEDPNNPSAFELIYIDGDHTYDGAKNDLDLAFRHLQPGGTVVFDDINHVSHPELFSLWQEYKERYPDYLFIEDLTNNGTACAFKPPFTKLINVYRKQETSLQPVSDSLPIHFFTIVLNGEPFIRKHISTFKNLPFNWHWHIIEGVADFKHDTAWSLKNGARITDDMHRKGRSNDGTSEYLDELCLAFPENVTVHRKPEGVFWDGKLEMVNAPLRNIAEECLLWQIDVDEIWTIDQLVKTHSIFVNDPRITAAFYNCRFFVGDDLVITTKNTYGNNSSYEWLRTWRYLPGDKWAAHEPPRLVRIDNLHKVIDVASINPILQDFTESNGLVFDHFAYVLESQLQFKESYYGYSNAVESWTRLQNIKDFPVKLRDYFPWVTDEALVDRLSTIENTCAQQSNRILWVRTDSIGDAVLAMSMLPHVKGRYPHAEITVLCQEHIAELYESCPHVDSVVPFNKERAYLNAEYRDGISAALCAKSFDIVLNSVFSREPLTDILALNTTAKQKVAFNGDSAHGMTENFHARSNPLYSHIIQNNGGYKLELERHREFLQALGVETPRLQPVIWTTLDDAEFAENVFQENGLDAGKTVVLFAGAQAEARTYNGYGQALVQLCKEQGFAVVALGSDSDFEVNEKNLNDLAGVKTLNLCGKTTLRQSAEILRRCRLAVGAETSMAHIACAVGTPNVVLLGGGHFGRFMPYSAITSAVALPVECYCCNWACKYDSAHCVKGISPEVITEAVRQTLEKGSNKPRIFLQGENYWRQGGNIPTWKMTGIFHKGVSADLIPVTECSTDDLQILSEKFKVNPYDRENTTNLITALSNAGFDQDATQLNKIYLKSHRVN